MRRNLWEHRIPTLLVLALLAIGTIATSYLAQTGINITGKAAIPQTPENVRITNIKDTSFTVSYTTQAPVIGSITYGADATLGNTAVDTRNGDQVLPHMMHVVTVNNLEPETTYFFSIISGEKSFLNGNKLFEVTTGTTLQINSREQRAAKGKVLLPNGDKPTDIIVYLTTDAAQMLSANVNEKNEYSFDLHTLRSASLQSFFDVSDNATINLLIVSPKEQSRATITAKNAATIPTITLSQNYDFTVGLLPLTSLEPSGASSSANIGFPSLTASQSAADVDILTPKKDDSFSDTKPTFRGKAVPSEEVTITIESTPITTTVTADKNGNWSYRPSTPLEPGEHTITITTKNQFGILQKITKTFTVFASGTQVTQPATPSATIAVQPSPTQTQPATPSPSPSPILPTIAPTANPTPFPTLPATGNDVINQLSLGALTIAAVGIILFLLTRMPTL